MFSYSSFVSNSFRVRKRLLDLRQDVRLAQHEHVLAVERDLGAAVLAVQHLVSLVDVEGDALLALVVPAAISDRDYLALLGLLLRGVGKHDATGRGLFLLDCPHDQPVAERLQLHSYLRWSCSKRSDFDSGLGTLVGRVPGAKCSRRRF